MINFKYQSLPISDSDLDAVENRFGFTLPTHLRMMYKHANGGRPVRDLFVLDGTIYVVDAVLPIKHSSSPLSTMEQSIQRLKRDRHILPDDLAPFAVDPFGDYFCFSLRQSDYGAIYMFRMDRDGNQSLPARLLSPSADDFFARLSTKK
jgi:hypothetical protein